MKNIETPDKMHLKKLIDKLRDGQYVIPDFQRDFEWSARDMIELIRSIFEDYYIGTLLFWKASKENLQNLKCEPIYGFSGKAEPTHIILDGQQRLSALYYAFFSPEKNYPKRKSRCFVFIDLSNLLDENYDECFLYYWDSKATQKLIKNKMEQFKKKLFPLYILGDKTSWAWIKWMEEYEKYWSEVVGEENAKKEREKIEHIFDDLINNYYISFIELDRDIEIAKVCDIFTRINSTGIELTIFDLMNAMLRPKEIYLKEMWRKVAKDFEPFDPEKMRLYLLQTMSILKQEYCSPKYLYYLVPGAKKTIKEKDGTKKKIVLVKSEEEFVELWNSVVEDVKRTLDMVKNPRDFGAIKVKFIPYPTMLPILVAINIEKKKSVYEDKQAVQNKIKQWYWASIFTRNYSSAVESQMAKDFMELKKWFVDDAAIPSVIQQLHSEIGSLSLKGESSYSSAVYKAVLNLIVLKGAKDWVRFELPEYVELQDHHIVPQSWGTKNNVKDIHSILNRTLLSDKTNNTVIGNNMPSIYLRKLFSSRKSEDIYTLLETHLISRKAVGILMRENFSEEDYQEFIKERERTILKEIKSLFGIDAHEQLNLITPKTPYSNKLQIESIIRKSHNYVYWLDKYFSKAGFDMILSALNQASETTIRTIRILTSIDKIDSNLRKNFKDFKKEIESKGIEVGLRVISSSISKNIHDRWILTGDSNYNVPSTDTIYRGQYSEIKPTKNRPPFEKWWEESLDIINDWNTIQKMKK